MKNSARPWLVAFFTSLLPLAYSLAEFLKFPIIADAVTNYVALAIGLLCTIPLWGAAVWRMNKSELSQDVFGLIALLVAYGYAFVVEAHSFIWQPLALTAILLLGGWILHSQITGLKRSTLPLSLQLNDKVTLVEGHKLKHVSLTEVEIGDAIVVRPGQQIPVDGYVLQGSSTVSETSVTRESFSIEKFEGDWVLAGSVNLDSRGSQALTIRVGALGEELVFNELKNSIKGTSEEKPQYSPLGRVSTSTTSIFSLSALFIFVGFGLVLGWGGQTLVEAAAGILLSPQLSVLARTVPLTNEATAIKLALMSVISKSRKTFESLARINHVVLTKTGVLTRGHKTIGKIHLARNTSIGSESELLALAAAVEMGTSHELGHLIIQEAAKRKLELPEVENISAIPGLGVSAIFDGSQVLVGNSGLVNISGVNLNPYDLFQVTGAYENGSSVVFISIDELLVGYIEFPDSLRENSPRAVMTLSGRTAITVLSGDATNLVEKITHELGLKDFAAEVLSSKKSEWISDRKASGSRILFVGDGKYDAAALAEADAGLSFATGPNVHYASCDLIQVSGDPLVIPSLLRLSRKSKVIKLSNLVISGLLSLGLLAGAMVGIYPAVIAFTGIAISWLLMHRIVRLVK